MSAPAFKVQQFFPGQAQIEAAILTLRARYQAPFDNALLRTRDLVVAYALEVGKWLLVANRRSRYQRPAGFVAWLRDFSQRTGMPVRTLYNWLGLARQWEKEGDALFKRVAQVSINGLLIKNDARGVSPLYGRGPGDQDWRTPPALFRDLDAVFHFTRDAAADCRNALCPRYWSEQADALDKDWSRRGEIIFCNPPFRKLRAFAPKAASAYCCVFFVPLNYLTDGYLHGTSPAWLVIPRRRLQFWHPHRAAAKLTFGTGFLVYGDYERNLLPSPVALDERTYQVWRLAR